MTKEISKDFNNIEDIATHLRELNKRKTLIFAHNGTGKTRLSMAFKELGKDNPSGAKDGKQGENHCHGYP